MTARLAGNAIEEWRARWPVVLAGAGGMAISTINVYSAGLFFEPFEQEFGWSRADISAGAVIPAIATVLFGPFMGAAVDRLGPRRVGIIGVTSLTLLTAMLSVVGPSIWSWWAMWIFLGAINVFIQPTIWTAAVSSFFSAGRGLALAITLSGSGIASLVTPLLTYYLIEAFGWRLAFVGLAAFWGVIVIPLVCFFLTSRRDQERIAAPAEAKAPGVLKGGLQQARTLRFIQLAVASFLIASVVVPFAVTLVPLLSWNQLPRGEAAGIAALLGFASIAGRLAIGYLLDHIEGRYLAVFSVCMPVLASLLLINFPGSAPAATAAVLILGLALGAELDLVAYLTTRYFGLAHFGFLFGTIAAFITLAGGVGPWVLSLVYDTTGSYHAALMAFMPMCVVSAVLFFLIGPYPKGVGEADLRSAWRHRIRCEVLCLRCAIRLDGGAFRATKRGQDFSWRERRNFQCFRGLGKCSPSRVQGRRQNSISIAFITWGGRRYQRASPMRRLRRWSASLRSSLIMSMRLSVWCMRISLMAMNAMHWRTSRCCARANPTRRWRISSMRGFCPILGALKKPARCF